STSLAALLDRINRTRNGHILTIEDPIEFVHVRKRCRISQREVRIHTESFTRALEDALRQDPDVIVVGEVRSDEQLQLILQAAETGHLVLGTAHTINAVNTITRLVGMVETARQGQVRAQIASNIESGTTVEIRSAIELRRDGMRTMEQSLAELVHAGHVTYAAARDHANDRKALERHMGATAESAYR
ncbi:MAG TPA: ATPase, T2SS/T4P/T4SS family, partial [Longimicrobium sp.]|nr:ATPase, T2SS/T4P/T4SS family [Longimicrobium sp.]